MFHHVCDIQNLRVGVLDLQNIGHVVPQVQKCIDRAASDLSDLGASVESVIHYFKYLCVIF
jgi:Asp-tRNA(Asn)/Glu-tRNA(Gln) amidotransferase A subunit family amidase